MTRDTLLRNDITEILSAKKQRDSLRKFVEDMYSNRALSARFGVTVREVEQHLNGQEVSKIPQAARDAMDASQSERDRIKSHISAELTNAALAKKLGLTEAAVDRALRRGV